MWRKIGELKQRLSQDDPYTASSWRRGPSELAVSTEKNTLEGHPPVDPSYDSKTRELENYIEAHERNA